MADLAGAVGSTAVTQSFFNTGDGVKLAYLEAGQGAPLILIHGWCQTASEFKYQLDAFSARYHVFALDLRGHGDSQKPPYGYRISRLAKDLDEFIRKKGLQRTILLGHSMGCKVIWSYLDLFGDCRIEKLVFVDQDARPNSPDERPQFRANNHLEWRAEVGLFVDRILGPSPERDWIIAENLKTPRPIAIRLHRDSGAEDWTDVVSRIRVDTLFIGGELSILAPTEVKQLAAMVPRAELEIFAASEKGFHLMFLTNHEMFNNKVLTFLQA